MEKRVKVYENQNYELYNQIIEAKLTDIKQLNASLVILIKEEDDSK